VDRALRVSTSFIARLHQHGDDWLESAEAEQAVLKKLTPTPNPLVPQEERRDTDRIAQTVPVHIINTFAPANSQNLSVPSSDNADGRSAARAGWANVWIALAVGVAVILVTLWVAGKL
jgi:hypothetical protein